MSEMDRVRLLRDALEQAATCEAPSAEQRDEWLRLVEDTDEWLDNGSLFGGEFV